MTRRGVPLGLASYAVAAVLALAIPACGPGAPSGPIVVTPNPLDFGRVSWTSTPTQTVTLRNASRRALVLKDPKFDCPCFFVAKAPPVVRLQPGQTVEMIVGLSSIKGEPGPFKKTLTVVCDDPKQPTLDVPVVGAIVDVRRIAPRDVDLGHVDAGGEPVERVVTVRGGSGYVARAVSATTSESALELETRDVPEGSDVLVRTRRDAPSRRIGAEVKLLIEVKGPDGKTTSYTERVAVRGTIGKT